MAKSIMIQGTMSNAGKSLLTAGLLRILKQDGYVVAPFKSQNMALNSYITKDGFEMGRAQVVQAEAAMLEPSVYMNPILLKPTNDTGSQVIVNGISRGNMPAKEYFKYKSELIPDILAAYKKLEEMADIIVIEGAGSPAEINLKQNDIVNMGMAKMAKAPVLLAGDIDRGGVFAQLYGTVALLEKEEQKMIKGLIINKFRGDKTILDPGIDMIQEKCNIPVVGVVPYANVDIEDEDSLSSRLSQKRSVAEIDIAVICVKRISNFTDFNRFECVEGVSLRYVHSVEELKTPDMIILPGSKNTMGDLKYLRQNGLEAAILKAHSAGCVIFGICGGYQMLGEQISDPYEAEEGGSMKGMGLLPMKTVFDKEKTRTRVVGVIRENDGILKELAGEKIEGYEIHMGVSSILDNNLSDNKKAVSFTNVTSIDGNFDKREGCCFNNVYGSYVHGFFDNEAVVSGIVKALAKRKGLDFANLKLKDYNQYKNEQYDKLADILRQSLDMKAIYKIINEGLD